MVVQGGSGWMCKLMNDKETCEYKMKHKKRNPKVKKRDELQRVISKKN